MLLNGYRLSLYIFTVTIIDNTPNVLIYIDSYLLTSINKEEIYTREAYLDFHINNFEINLSDTKTLIIDNFKVWDLDLPAMADILYKSLI